MFTFRVGFPSREGIQENQIEAHGLEWGDMRLIEYLANDKEPAAGCEGGPHMLEDLLHLVRRQYLEEFAHNGDLIGPGHGTADNIGRVDRDAVRRSRLRDRLGRDGVTVGRSTTVAWSCGYICVRVTAIPPAPPPTSTRVRVAAKS